MPTPLPYLPRVVVRFKPDVQVPYQDNIGPQVDQLSFSTWSNLEGRFSGIQILRLLRSLEPQKLEAQYRRAEAALGLARRQVALSSFVIECPDNLDARDVAREVATWSTVEAAYVDRVTKAPRLSGCSAAYLGVASAGGIDAQFAGTQAGGDGNGEPFIDLELAWAFAHQAVSRYGLTKPIFGAIENNAFDFEHGTSTLGVVCGDDSAGFLGVAPGAQLVGVVSQKRDAKSTAAMSTIPDAIAAAVEVLRPLGGGVLLLEVMTDDFLPVESDSECFTAIRNAVGNGVTVIEPAGNNGFNLDTDPGVRDASGRQYLDRSLPAPPFQDSGAIMVGASDHVPSGGFSRRNNSNFGSRIDCYAWGDGVQTSVANALSMTTGFGPPCYVNTSAAAAIIAGAALCVQGRTRQLHGVRLTPQRLRTLLGTLGTPESTGTVGVMPDLQAIFAAL